jgi:hypothetical protein
VTVSCGVCMTAAAIVSEYDEATRRTFWLCPACWTEYLHGLDEATGEDGSDEVEVAVEVVPGGGWVCPACHDRRQVAS